MREIKFRVWDNEANHYAPLDCVYGFIVGHTKENIVIGNKDGWSHLDVEQYTGLKDSEEREIYEGDIVQDFRSKLYEIIYNEDCCRYELKGINNTLRAVRIDCDKVLSCELEVIGNIHQHKHLLKGE